ncbi:hypothetical protein AGLY_013680 [Aphis glycines]|uniref:Uncharacterized protein n=1 Tax=Aphis glycines TaxID=307491 RepID=A0A6G0T8A9_APHGL|nr:hypothetical protein AGLY_013680 [Aphis glycines]
MSSLIYGLQLGLTYNVHDKNDCKLRDDVKGGNPGLILIEWRTNVHIDLCQVPDNIKLTNVLAKKNLPEFHNSDDELNIIITLIQQNRIPFLIERIFAYKIALIPGALSESKRSETIKKMVTLLSKLEIEVMIDKMMNTSLGFFLKLVPKLWHTVIFLASHSIESVKKSGVVINKVMII